MKIDKLVNEPFYLGDAAYIGKDKHDPTALVIFTFNGINVDNVVYIEGRNIQPLLQYIREKYGREL
jgi:hypothetical protein